MKTIHNTKIIGIDHGYGNMKTANCCFPTGITAYDHEQLFTADMLVYGGRYYLIGEGHKEFAPDKIKDEDYYVLTLAAIAKELNVPMIALSQLSRATEMRGGSKRPQLSDLRESGAIEQDADIVAFIHRPEYYGINQDENGMPTAGMAEIILAKHRNGAVCDVNLRFLKEQARFADMEDSMLPPAQASDSQQAYDDYASGSNGTSASAGLGASMGGEFDVNRSKGLNDEAPF